MHCANRSLGHPARFDAAPVILLISLLALCALVGTAHAAMVAHVPFSQSHSRPLTTSPGSASDAVVIRFLFEDAGGIDDLTTEVFDGFVFRAADAGQRFVIGAADDPEFDAFVARATNGLDDRLLHLVTGNQGGGGGSSDLESNRYRWPGAGGSVDLAGEVIQAVSLNIDYLAIDPTASTGQQNWAVSGRLVFHDVTPVPLPSALGLFAAALVLLSAQARKARTSR